MARTGSTKVSASYPAELEIEFVPAADLRVAQRFNWLTTIFSVFATGFWGTLLTAQQFAFPLFSSSLIFTAAAFFFAYTAASYNKKAYGKTIKVSSEITHSFR